MTKFFEFIIAGLIIGFPIWVWYLLKFLYIMGWWST